MGDRRALHRAVGRPAVRLAAGAAARLAAGAAGRLAAGAGARLARAAAALLLLLGGCETVADVSGLATGTASGAATASPAVGFVVGVATRGVVLAGLNAATRRRQQTEQDAIASAAGDLPEGGSATWQVRHDIPIGNEDGEVHVVRSIDTPLATCKEIAFSVAAEPPAWFTTTICRDGEMWKWALAEPAVARWRFLQ